MVLLLRQTALILLAMVLFAISLPLSAEVSAYRLQDHTLVVTTPTYNITVRFLTSGSVEVLYRDNGEEPLPSFAIENDESREVAAQFSENERQLVFASQYLKVLVDKQTASLSYQREDKPLIAEQPQGYLSENGRRGFRFTLDPGEKLLGAGERVLGMDRRGWRLPLDNRGHYGYETHSTQMYFSVPALVSSKKYMVLFDNPAKGVVDIGKTDPDTLAFESVGGRAAYVIMAAESYPALMSEYVSVTGRQPLPPRWVFGNFASRMGYRTQAQVIDVVERYRKLDIPLDALVLDLFWFGPDIKGHMGNLAWDKKAFPEPEKMLGQLSEQGVETVLITEPFILRSSTRWNEAVEQDVLVKDQAGGAKTFDFYFGQTGLIDIFDTQAQDWFWGIYQDLLNQGVSGLWGDLGEPEAHPDNSVHTLGRGDELHNAYGHEWAAMVYQRHLQQFPDRRPMILMRSGFAGSQRYGMIPWTGDVNRSWGGLQSQVELSLQMGLMGLAYIHSDLGGFAGGETFDPELYLRWLQLGVFQPVFRPHAQEHIAPEPVFHDAQTINRARRLIRLRYRLLPYLYSLAWENSRTGIPMAKPLFFADESNVALFDDKDSFLWGDSFLVSPVTRPGVKQWSLNLPPGNWFDFWDDTLYRGGQQVIVPVDAERFPVLVKGGAFVPMLKGGISNTRKYSTRELDLHYYVDTDEPPAEYRLYDDDGKTHDAYQQGQYELLVFKGGAQGKGKFQFEFIRQGQGYPGSPDTRRVTLWLHKVSRSPASIRVNGRELAPAEYTYDGERGLLRFDLSWERAPLVIAIELAKNR